MVRLLYNATGELPASTFYEDPHRSLPRLPLGLKLAFNLSRIPVHTLVMEANEFDVSCVVLYQGRAVFNPVTGVHVKNVADLADFRPMYVATDYPIHAALTGELQQRILVIRDIFHGPF